MHEWRRPRDNPAAVGASLALRWADQVSVTAFNKDFILKLTEAGAVLVVVKYKVQVATGRAGIGDTDLPRWAFLVTRCILYTMLDQVQSRQRRKWLNVIGLGGANVAAVAAGISGCNGHCNSTVCCQNATWDSDREIAIFLHVCGVGVVTDADRDDIVGVEFTRDRARNYLVLRRFVRINDAVSTNRVKGDTGGVARWT
nr:hypothetical protein [Veronia nyctiphanis]